MSKGVKFKKALDFAEIAYHGIYRKNTEPLLEHAKRVVNLLEEINIHNEDILIAALLHDALKVGQVSEKDITDEFGTDVNMLIKILTDISEIQLPMDDDLLIAENLHKTFIHLTKDIRVLIIRLADRVDNIRTIEALPQKDKVWSAKHTLIVYAPIAKAVGLYYYTRELENYALKVLDPERYYKIDAFIEENLKGFEDTFKSLVDELSEELIQQNVKHEITYRTKSIYSIHTKAITRHHQGKIAHIEDFENLNDLLGMRILVENIEQCYTTLGLIQKKFNIVQKEYDDYIVNPKPNGYRTLQTAAKVGDKFYCEIQIRTFEMHEYNEYGPASHFSYKYSNSKTYEEATWIKDLIVQKDNLQKELASNSEIKVFEDSIFVFTPKDELIVLPAGSTPIDFAYEIHSDIGNKCVRALVDEKQVSLDTPLKSGQKVKIITEKGRTPSPDWLKFVKSDKAKDFIRKQTKKENIKK